MSGHQGGHRSTGWRTDGGSCGARRPPEPTVMVSSHENELAHEAPTELLGERVRPQDGVVLLAIRESPATLAGRVLDAAEELSAARLSVVATTRPGPRTEAAAADESRPDTGAGAAVDVDGETVAVDFVGADPDPTSLADAVESGFDGIDADRVHLLVDGLSKPTSGDVEAVYRRAHGVAMAVGRKPGLALFAVDADGFSPGFLDRLAHLFDVHLRLRRSRGCRQARWTGLTGTSDGWRPWSEIELRMTTPA